MIPRLIHQTWKDASVPERFVAAQASWRRHHPAWEYRLWTDADLADFVARQYPEYLALYQSYPDHIQRVDAARYMILHHFGGLYADLDVVCERSFDDLLCHDVVLPATEPLGVSNDLMAGRKGAEFFAFAVTRLPRAKRFWPRGLVPRHFRVLLTTGSLFLTLVLRAWRGTEQPHILAPEEYSVAGHPRAYVSHIHGSTWHEPGSDVMVGAYYRGKALLGRARAAFARVWR